MSGSLEAGRYAGTHSWGVFDVVPVEGLTRVPGRGRGPEPLPAGQEPVPARLAATLVLLREQDELERERAYPASSPDPRRSRMSGMSNATVVTGENEESALASSQSLLPGVENR